MGIRVDFDLPDHLPGLLAEMDAFIDAEIKPLEAENMQYFDRRREFARTDLENGGIPTRAWEDLLDEMRRRADAAGWLRYGLPKQFGGRDGTNLDMAVIREHLAHKGLGLHNDLQDESSIVGNFPQVIMMDRFGTDEQKALWCDALITGERSMAFGLTEPNHGSDATWLETTAVADGEDWVINGSKRWNTGVHRATHDLIFARTSGVAGQARGITAFLVPTDAPGFTVPYYWWTFNMPTDHGEVELRDVRVPADAVLGEVDRGLEVGQTFLHENRIRQAASSLGAAQYCIDRAVEYASEREVFGKPLAVNQAVQWPLVELHTEAQMVRLLVYYAATHLDRPSPSAPHVRGNHMEVSDKVSMANYRANRLVCEAADRAMQVHGGVGYSRHEPFEHIYRHHRRYRITEGAEEIQIRRVAQRMFKFGSRVGQ
jgi:alkylation response protein AidB-like acyl-CoA dehydrogenase